MLQKEGTGSRVEHWTLCESGQKLIQSFSSCLVDWFGQFRHVSGKDRRSSSISTIGSAVHARSTTSPQQVRQRREYTCTKVNAQSKLMSPKVASDMASVQVLASCRLAALFSFHQALSSRVWLPFPLLVLVLKAGCTGFGVAGMTLTGCMPKSLRNRCRRPDAAATVICITTVMCQAAYQPI